MENNVCSPYEKDRRNATIQPGVNEGDQSKKFIILAIYIIIICLAIPGNLSVILYMWKKKHFSTNFSVYATSLALTDFIIGMLAVPMYLATLFHPDLFCDVSMCIFLGFVEFVPASVSIFLLNAIAYDRYICVTSPLLYRSRFTKMRSVVISTAMWILGIVTWIPYFFGMQHDGVYSVTFLGSCGYFFGYFALGQAVLAYYLPAIFLVVLYVLMQRALKKRTIISESGLQTRRQVYTVENELTQEDDADNFKTMRNKIVTQQGSSVAGARDQQVIQGTVSEEPDELCRFAVGIHQTICSVENQRTLGVDPRRTTSRKSSHIMVQNRTIFKTIRVVVIAFLVCWAPFFIIWPIMGTGKSRGFDFVHETSCVLAFANSALNPFIYVLTSKSVRSDIMSVVWKTSPAN